MSKKYTDEQLEAIEKLRLLGVDIETDLQVEVEESNSNGIIDIYDALEDAHTDTTPTLKPQEDDILIMGNPNDIVEDENEYVIKFYGLREDRFLRLPKQDGIVKNTFDSETGTLTTVYKAKSITPALSEKMQAYAQIIQASFLAMTDEGDIEYMSRETIIKQAKFFVGEGIDATRNLLQTYFGFDKELMEHIPSTEATRLYSEVIRNNPNFFQ